MTQITRIYRPDDYPGNPDESTRQQLSKLFETLFPGVSNPEIDKNHDGVAITAHNPGLALRLTQLTGYISLEMPWSQRADLRDLAIQTVNTYYQCDYAFQTRVAGAESAGVSADLQSAIATWETSDLFNDEQRLVIEYTEAVLKGAVTEELTGRAIQAYSEKGVVEFTAVVSLFASWAMILKATRID